MQIDSLTTPHSHLIFDFDGVLVDSEVIAIGVEEVRFTAAGFPITAAEIAERFVGLSNDTIVGELEAQFGRSFPEGLMAAVQKETLERFPTELQPIDGIETVLANNSLPRAIASSSDMERIQLSLGITKLEDHFEKDLVFSAQMVENGKPAPDLFLLAAERMGADPESCVVIEDSPHGATAGVSAGMTVIGFTAGGHATPALASRLRDAGVTTIAQTATELAQLLTPNES